MVAAGRTAFVLALRALPEGLRQESHGFCALVAILVLSLGDLMLRRAMFRRAAIVFFVLVPLGPWALATTLDPGASVAPALVPLPQYTFPTKYGSLLFPFTMAVSPSYSTLA